MEKHLLRQIDLLKTQKDEAEKAARSHEEEIDEKSKFWHLVLMTRLCNDIVCGCTKYSVLFQTVLS